MFFGALSVLQAVFLPGYLLIRLCRVRTGSIIETAVLTFALSLIVNYMAVFLLVVAGLYQRTTVLLLVTAELLLLTWLILYATPQTATWFSPVRLRRIRSSGRVPVILIAASGAGILLTSLAALAQSLKFQPFDAWDTVFSWNRWAYVWFEGQLPRDASLYPQLIPANWSMMYHVAGSPELQMLPLGIMPLFAIAILAMFFDLALARQRVEYLIAILLCLGSAAWFHTRFFAPHESMIGGYVDLPVTFMTLTAFYLLELRDDRLPREWRELALPLVIAAGATVTKLNGGYALGIVLILALLGHWQSRRELRARDWARTLLLATGVPALIAGGWYGMRVVDFARGLDAPNNAGLSQAVDAAGGAGGVAERFIHAFTLFPLPWIALPLILAGLTLGLFAPRTRWVALGIVLPYSLLWARFLSYDLRNWMVMIPLVSYVSAFGLVALLQKFWILNTQFSVTCVYWRPRRHLTPIFAAVAAAVVVALVFGPSTSGLVTSQVSKQRSIGNPNLNTLLYKVFGTKPFLSGRLVTDYWYLQLLPGFRSDPLRAQHSNSLRITTVYHKGVTLSDLQGQDYIVLSDLVPPDVSQAIEKRIANGQYLVLASFSSRPFMSYTEPVKIRILRASGVVQ